MKRSIFTSFRLWFRRLWAVVIFFVAISNFVLACTASRSLRVQTIEHFSTITNEIVRTSIITQIISSVSSPVSVDGNFDYIQSIDHPTSHYRYMLINGRKAVQLFGRLHYVGSFTSYGRILDIFPDRILLDSGDTISNQNLKGNINGSGTVLSAFGGSRGDQ